MSVINRVLTCVAVCLMSLSANAAVWCSVSNVEVDASDHGGVYFHGNMSGTPVSFIVICGLTGGQQDCNSKATDRRLAVVLAAQAQGKNVMAYFSALNSCANYQPYMIPSVIRSISN